VPNPPSEVTKGNVCDFTTYKYFLHFFIYSYFYIAKWSSETTLKNGAKPKSFTIRKKTIKSIFFMKIKLIVTLLFTLALKFNLIAAERVENEKKTAESVSAVAKADVLKAEMKGLSMSESAKLVNMAVKDTKAIYRQNGTVKFWDHKKGHGFIKADDDGADIFVHFSAIPGTGIRSLKAGQRVSFVVKKNPKGLQAEDLVLL
jgi:CspA family cold shock protein